MEPGVIDPTCSSGSCVFWVGFFGDAWFWKLSHVSHRKWDTRTPHHPPPPPLKKGGTAIATTQRRKPVSKIGFRRLLGLTACSHNCVSHGSSSCCGSTRIHKNLPNGTHPFFFFCFRVSGTVKRCARTLSFILIQTYAKSRVAVPWPVVFL